MTDPSRELREAVAEALYLAVAPMTADEWTRWEFLTDFKREPYRAEVERIFAEHPATGGEETQPCEHDTLGCRDRTPHDEHAKIGDGRPCCGWPPACRAEVDAGGVGGLAARIYAQRDLLPSRLADPHGRTFRKEDAENLARAILASDWLAEEKRKAAEGALREAADDMVWDFADHPVTRPAVRQWLREQADRIGKP